MVIDVLNLSIHGIQYRFGIAQQSVSTVAQFNAGVVTLAKFFTFKPVLCMAKLALNARIFCSERTPLLILGSEVQWNGKPG